jgi:hypothetical protein
LGKFGIQRLVLGRDVGADKNIKRTKSQETFGAQVQRLEIHREFPPQARQERREIRRFRRLEPGDSRYPQRSSRTGFTQLVACLLGFQ